MSRSLLYITSYQPCDERGTILARRCYLANQGKVEIFVDMQEAPNQGTETCLWHRHIDDGRHGRDSPPVTPGTCHRERSWHVESRAPEIVDRLLGARRISGKLGS